VGGIHFPALERAAFKKLFQNGLGLGAASLRKEHRPWFGIRPFELPPPELMQDAEWVMVGLDGSEIGIMVQKNKAVDVNAFRRKAGFGPPRKYPYDGYKDKPLYHSRKDGSVMYLPNPSLVVIQRVSDIPSLYGLLDDDLASLAPEMAERVRKLEKNALWFVMATDGDVATLFKREVLGLGPFLTNMLGLGKGAPSVLLDEKELERLKKLGYRVEVVDDYLEVIKDKKDLDNIILKRKKQQEELKSVRLAFKNARFVTFAANPSPDGKSLTGEMTLECASGADARKLDKAFAAHKAEIAAFIGTNPLFAGDKKVEEQFVADLKASFKSRTVGPRLTITATIRPATWGALEAFQKDRDKSEKERD
jgi:hypothetical protein